MADVLCFDDLDLFGRELDDPLAELEQDLVHRVYEVPGSNLDDPERGLGLRDRLNGIEDAALGPQIEAELSRDGRVDAARATRKDVSASSREFEVVIQVNGKQLNLDLDLAASQGKVA